MKAKGTGLASAAAPAYLGAEGVAARGQSFRSARIKWGWGMVWPAAGPSFTPRLNASGAGMRCDAKCGWVQLIQTIRRPFSALVSSGNRVTGRRALIRVWPGEMGNLSRRIAKKSSRATKRAGLILPNAGSVSAPVEVAMRPGIVPF